MRTHKRNISVPYDTVKAFLKTQNGGSPEEAAKAARDLVAALKEADTKLQKGIDDHNLTVCIGKLAYVCPVDAQRFLRGEIPCLTMHRRKKETRHMGVYFKHTPSFYINNPPGKGAKK